jgi:hypothetical protein
VHAAAQQEEMTTNVFKALEERWLKRKLARTFPLGQAAESVRVIKSA